MLTCVWSLSSRGLYSSIPHIHKSWLLVRTRHSGYVTFDKQGRLTESGTLQERTDLEPCSPSLHIVGLKISKSVGSSSSVFFSFQREWGKCNSIGFKLRIRMVFNMLALHPSWFNLFCWGCTWQNTDRKIWICLDYNPISLSTYNSLYMYYKKYKRSFLSLLLITIIYERGHIKIERII